MSVRTPAGAAADAVFALLVSGAAGSAGVLPVPTLGESLSRPASAAMDPATGRSVFAWLNLLPASPEVIETELGVGGAIRHTQFRFEVQWVVIGASPKPGLTVSPARDRFEAGLSRIATALAAAPAARLLAVPGSTPPVAPGWLTMDPDPLALQGMAAAESHHAVHAAGVFVSLLLAVASPIN